MLSWAASSMMPAMGHCKKVTQTIVITVFFIMKKSGGFKLRIKTLPNVKN